MTRASALLLLDLDGVCALERTAPNTAAAEIFRLHEDLRASLAALDTPAAVITHRSRKEALQILAAIGVGRDAIRGVFSAEDFLIASLGRPLDLFRRGLKKSAALPAIERKFGLAREDIAVIDDRDDVLQDLQSHGLGLCMKAPGQNSDDPQAVIAFDFSEAVRILKDWRQGSGAEPCIRPLTAITVQAPQDRGTGLNTRWSKVTLFSAVRLLARRARQMRRGAM